MKEKEIAKKIFRVEKENSFNGGLDFNTYDEALNNINKQLHDEANYNYNANCKHVYSLCEVNVLNDNDDDYEEEYFDTLLSMSVAEYKGMTLEEKHKNNLKY